MNRKDAFEWIKVTISLVLMIYSGSKAIQYLPIPVFTIFKNLTIILIAYLEKGNPRHNTPIAFYNGAPITKNIFIAFMLMVFSSLIAGYTDITHGHVVKEGSVGAFVAYFWMVFNCLSTAALTLSMKSTMKKVNFKDYDTVYFNSTRLLDL
jgi:GDP-mannose transporter